MSMDKEQPLVQHLLELRTRVLKIVGLVALIFLGLMYFANEIYTFFASPLIAVLPQDGQMIATEVASTFFAPLKITFIASIFAAIPYILHQIWAFISPGLYQHEKRLALPLLFFSTFLFYAGMAFAYFVVFPIAFQFFSQFGPEGVTMMTDINKYLEFIIKLFFAFGFSFEIPIATLLLIWSGVTTRKSLAHKRPYVVVGCFIIGMLFTPPDVLSQFLLAVPMWILFELGLVLSVFLTQSNDQQSNEKVS